ncbi:MAG: hypothetical protein HS132_04395 [Planctomycetia bacterium]|nr:hypothetical protein [Planctomycetia bacterium]
MNNFKHNHKTTFQRIDRWIQMRLRNILKSVGRKGRGELQTIRDGQMRTLANLGLFTLTTAHALVCQSRRGNH